MTDIRTGMEALVGPRIRLRPLLASDAGALVNAASDGDLWNLPFTTVPSSDTVADYIRIALEGRDAGTVLPFVTEIKESNLVVGSTRFWKIDRKNRKLEIGSTWLSTSWQKTFVNTEAKFLMLRYAFEELHCVRVQLTTDVINEKSRSAILRLGAKQEGILRNERIMPDGRKRDSASSTKSGRVCARTRAVCGLKGRSAGLQRRLIDKVQSAGFAEYTDHLRQAQNGNRRIQQQLLEHGKEATAHLDRMLADAQTAGAVIEDIAIRYSKEERRAIRLGENYSPALIEKTARDILHIADTAFREHPNGLIRPTCAELPNTYIFRASLCTYLLALEWGALGGARDATPEKLRNDFVDMSFAAYATYFDGLMTADAKVLRIHREARVWLTALFDCELPRGFSYQH